MSLSNNKFVQNCSILSFSWRGQNDPFSRRSSCTLFIHAQYTNILIIQVLHNQAEFTADATTGTKIFIFLLPSRSPQGVRAGEPSAERTSGSHG